MKRGNGISLSSNVLLPSRGAFVASNSLLPAWLLMPSRRQCHTHVDGAPFRPPGRRERGLSRLFSAVKVDQVSLPPGCQQFFQTSKADRPPSSLQCPISCFPFQPKISHHCPSELFKHVSYFQSHLPAPYSNQYSHPAPHPPARKPPHCLLSLDIGHAVARSRARRHPARG